MIGGRCLPCRPRRVPRVQCTAESRKGVRSVVLRGRGEAAAGDGGGVWAASGSSREVTGISSCRSETSSCPRHRRLGALRGKADLGTTTRRTVPWGNGAPSSPAPAEAPTGEASCPGGSVRAACTPALPLVVPGPGLQMREKRRITLTQKGRHEGSASACLTTPAPML